MKGAHQIVWMTNATHPNSCLAIVFGPTIFLSSSHESEWGSFVRRTKHQRSHCHAYYCRFVRREIARITVRISTHKFRNRRGSHNESLIVTLGVLNNGNAYAYRKHSHARRHDRTECVYHLREIRDNSKSRSRRSLCEKSSPFRCLGAALHVVVVAVDAGTSHQ